MFCEDSDFAELDESGLPLTPACRICGDCVHRLRPGTPHVNFCVDFTAAARGPDPTLQHDFEQASPVYIGKAEVVFNPNPKPLTLNLKRGQFDDVWDASFSDRRAPDGHRVCSDLWIHRGRLAEVRRD